MKFGRDTTLKVEAEDALCRLSATAAIRKIQEKEISALELAKSCVARINEIEDMVKAWAYFDEAKMLSHANAVDEKINNDEPIGPLCGIPVGIKDVFNTKDMPTCMGSPIWEGFTPGNDARVVTYIRWADGIIAGKTVTAEFAVHHPGPTVNPHNFAHSPGTSSSGSAAAVAAFMVPLALGTQTAGSTIRPASYCGIYGFKPSFGLIPRIGILKTLDTLDHVTFFSRAINDLYLMFEAIRAKGHNYPLISKFLEGQDGREKTKKNNEWKVAFVRTPAWNEAEGYAKEAILNYASSISKLKGLSLEEVDLPEGFNSVHDVHDLIYTKALSYYFKDEYDAQKEKISQIFREMVENGRRISIEDYSWGLERQRFFIHQLDEFFEKYDFILTLSTAGEAPKGLYARDKKDSCLIWTLCHAPAINLPVFKSPKGLPFGAQIVSRRYRDYDLLDFAKILERGGKG